MSNFYKSLFYSKPIEVHNIEWEKFVIITDDKGRESIYSWYDIVEKTSESFYINKCLLWGFIRKTPRSVLIIWFWWGSFAKYLQDRVETINITWIDIDESMLDIAKKEFDVKIDDFYLLDALKALEIIEKKKKKYDLVLIDVYGSNWESPEYLAEDIFIKKLKNILSKTWIISVNFANYDLNNDRISAKYNKMHSNLLDNFWKYYSHILKEKNDRWNVVGIYNLDKFYTADDYSFNYLKSVQNGDISYDSNIVKDFIIEFF